MGLWRFAGPVVGRACRSPGPTRYCHVEGEAPGKGKAKAQETRWATREGGDAESRMEGRINERAEVKEQAPEGKVGHRGRVESGRFNAVEWKKGRKRKWS